MNKIEKETIFLLLTLLSVIGTILSFIFLQQYIPDYFNYINDNWNSGFTGILQRGSRDCKIPLLKDKSIKVYKKFQKDFFNNIETIDQNFQSPDDLINYNINKTYYASIIQCLDNRTNYFDTKIYKYGEKNNFTQCKYIDTLNNTSCDYYTNNMMFNATTKFTQVVYAQGPPCFDPRYYNFNISFNKTSYYYDKNGCPGGRVSKHYQKLKEISLLSILEYNGLNDTIGKNLDKETYEQILYFYGRNYIGIKEKCRNKPFRELKNIIDEKHLYISSSIVWLGYIIIIEIIFLLLFLNRYIVKYHNFYNNKNKNKDDIIHKELLPPYTKPVLLILSLIMLGFHVLVFTYLLNIRDFIDLFEDVSCFEEEAGELIKPSIIYLLSGKYTQMAVLGINVILAFKYGIKKGIKYAN